MGAPRGPAEEVDEVEDVRPWARREEAAALLGCGWGWGGAEVTVPPRMFPPPPLLLLGLP